MSSQDTPEGLQPQADGRDEADQEKGAKRQRSTIAFPYGDLDDGVAVAEAVWNFGGRCDLNNLAAALRHGSPASGAFRIKVATAKTFGLIDGSGQEVELTTLGRRLMDQETEAAARVDAFLNVPLYLKIFDEVSATGGLLPGDPGLEDMIRRMGVVPTQVDRARQAFQRSARQAGFNRHGARRLLRPPLATIGSEDSDPDEGSRQGTERESARERDGGDDSIGTNKPPIIAELFRRLPNEGEAFPEDERRRWKAVFEASLDLIYGPASVNGQTESQIHRS